MAAAGSAWLSMAVATLSEATYSLPASTVPESVDSRCFGHCFCCHSALLVQRSAVELGVSMVATEVVVLCTKLICTWT